MAIGLACLAFSLLLSWRSIADSLSSAPQASDTVSTSSPDPTSPTPIETSSPQQPETSTSDTSTDSIAPTPTPTPLAPMVEQNMRIAVPQIIPVDPRARSALLPSIFFSGTGTLLLCIDSNQDSISIAGPLINSDSFFSQGNGTNHFAISGPVDEVLTAVNGYGMTRIFSTYSGLGNTTLDFRFIAMNQVSSDFSFCSQADASNTRTLHFQAVDLNLDMTKASVRVK
jgi:hypothetical protein